MVDDFARLGNYGIISEIEGLVRGAKLRIYKGDIFKALEEFNLEDFLTLGGQEYLKRIAKGKPEAQFRQGDTICKVYKTDDMYDFLVRQDTKPSENQEA